MHGIEWNSGRLDYSEPSNSLPRAIKGDYFRKRLEKCKILGSLWDKDVEKLEDHGCPKVQDLVGEELGFAGVTQSDTRPHFTVQSVKENCLVTG